MSRRIFIAALLAAVSAPAWASDLKPGQWEMTMSMEGENLPSQLTEERTSQMCLTGGEADDMGATMRERWRESDCTDINLTREGNSIQAQASCQQGGRTTSVDAHVTLHSDEHYTSEIVTTNDGTLTTRQAGQWVSSECEAGAGREG
ncbi:DUF3617 family protein [Halomonas sp. THAF12]|uniref:DUF3617 domain-containing protein n=1 Tax=Halomonas sp. B23F22_10 TaxID=3459515 RepID=UPI00373F4B4A